MGVPVVALGLVVGLSGFAGAASGIDHTGHNSYNKIKNQTTRTMRVNNDNDLKVENNNRQKAYTGDVVSKDNTTSGDSMTGDAGNATALSLSGTVNNAGSSSALAGMGMSSAPESATISQTGSDSENVVTNTDTTRVNIRNDNDIKVENNNHQLAASGSATVKDNTTAGNAKTGDAKNTSTTTISFNVTN